MATVNDLPPITHITKRFALCEWAERVLVRTHGSQAEFLGIGYHDAIGVIDQLYAHAEKTFTPSARALMFSIDAFEWCVYHAETDESGNVTVPMEIAINLAQRVMKHACH